LEDIVKSGKALKKFTEIVENQNGQASQITNPSLLPRTKYQKDIYSHKKGYIKKLEAKTIGQAAMLLGAGRKKKDEHIDLSVGIVLKKKIGDEIDTGEVLATVYYNDNEKFNLIKESVQRAFHIAVTKTKVKPLILKVIG